MDNNKCCNNCCQEDDLLCCEPLKHCCGGYSEHNNCCPHDKCCNQCCGCHGHKPCCGDDCKKCNCICPCIKKAIGDTKDKLEKDINVINNRITRDEDKLDQNLVSISNDITNVIENEKKDVIDLNKRIDKEIADRIDDVDAEEARAINKEADLNSKIDKEIADRKSNAFEDVEYINKSGDAYIKFLNANGDEVGRVDAKPFIKDGILDDVKLVEYQGNKALRFIFNTDAGKSTITIDIGDLFENNDYYDKTQIDARLNTINTKIADEVAKATEIHNNLGSAITTVNMSLTNKITDESNRAKEAESTLTTNLNSEITRATQTENTLDSKITSEITRAKESENNLGAGITSVSTSLSSKINEEISRAKAAEKTNADAITALSDIVVTDVTYNESTRYISKTINGTSHQVAHIPAIPANVSAFTNDAGYLTQHQDISGKANISDLPTVAITGNYNDLINKPTIPTIPTLATVATTGDYNDLINKPTITIDGTSYTIQQAITNLYNQIQELENKVLWEVSSTDNNKIVAKNNKQAVAAGFFDSTVD